MSKFVEFFGTGNDCPGSNFDPATTFPYSSKHLPLLVERIFLLIHSG